MRIDTEQEIQLVEKLVDRLGRKLAIVVIMAGMIMSIQPAETFTDKDFFWFRITQVAVIGLISIAGLIAQYKLDRKTPSKGDMSERE